MLTAKLDITYISDEELLTGYTSSYTGLFYKMYNNQDLMGNRTFIDSELNEHIDRSIYEFCVSDVKNKLKQHLTLKEKKLKEIEDISKELDENKFKTKWGFKRKYKLINKLAFLNRTINNDMCFGGKALLREITKLSQLQDKSDGQIKLLAEKKKEFKENRSLGIYLVGQANCYGNRKVFHLILI